jgi:hypothetical protein
MAMFRVGDVYPKVDPANPDDAKRAIGIVAGIYLDGKYLLIATSTVTYGQGGESVIHRGLLIECTDLGDKTLAKFVFDEGEPYFELQPRECFAEPQFSGPFRHADRCVEAIIEACERWYEEQALTALQLV